MFTGIVEELGSLRSRDGIRFTFAASLVTEDAKIGDSIAVNGCCLTVVEVGPGWWAADVVDESLSRTNLGDLTPGDRDAVPTSTTFSAGDDFAFSPDGRRLAYTATPLPAREEDVPIWDERGVRTDRPIAGRSGHLRVGQVARGGECGLLPDRRPIPDRLE